MYQIYELANKSTGDFDKEAEFFYFWEKLKKWSASANDHLSEIVEIDQDKWVLDDYARDFLQNIATYEPAISR